MISSTKDYEQEGVTHRCICGVLFLWTSKGSKTEEFLSNDFITINSSPLAFVLNRLIFMVKLAQWCTIGFYKNAV